MSICSETVPRVAKVGNWAFQDPFRNIVSFKNTRKPYIFIQSENRIELTHFWRFLITMVSCKWVRRRTICFLMARHFAVICFFVFQDTGVNTVLFKTTGEIHTCLQTECRVEHFLQFLFIIISKKFEEGYWFVLKRLIVSRDRQFIVKLLDGLTEIRLSDVPPTKIERPR